MRFPFFTILVVIINFLIFMISFSNFKETALTFGLIPAHFNIGSLLTYSFLHDGFGHLFINMAGLYVFGSRMEKVWGWLEYAVFCICASIFSGLVYVFSTYIIFTQSEQNHVMVGSSGIVFAVMGFCAIRFHHNTAKIRALPIPIFAGISAIIITQLILALISIFNPVLRSIAFASHIGGFAFGVAAAIITGKALEGEREYLTQKAEEFMQSGSMLEAIQCYEILLKYDPENAMSYAELGRIWGILEDEKQSIPCYMIAVELYTSGGSEDKAIETQKEMRCFWPNVKINSSAKFRLAQYLEESGQPERAMDEFFRLSEEEPQTLDAEMALLKLAQMQSALSDNPEIAKNTYTDFLNRYPNSKWKAFAEKEI
jgi:membrane associated rhomboid family serine protease